MFTDIRQSMLIIDGKNNSDDATSMENKMERTTMMLAENFWQVYRKSVHGKNNNEDTEEQAREAQEE